MRTGQDRIELNTDFSLERDMLCLRTYTLIRSELISLLAASWRSTFQIQIQPGMVGVLERFSYDLEMKTREQNRNNKQTEIERFDWFIERTDKRVWLLAG